MIMEKLNVTYGMPESGGPKEIPAIIPGPPGFGVMPDLSNPEPPAPGVPFDATAPYILIDGAELTVARDVKAETLTAGTVDGFEITCDEDLVGGVCITGTAKTTISNAKLAFSGNCVNDFEGNGAAIRAIGKSVVEVANAEITAGGVLRSCLNANEHAYMYVHDCTLVCEGGDVPANWPGSDLIGGPGMCEAPPSMGVAGHSRLSLTEGNAHSYFENCKVVSDGWAGLSTDGAWGDCYLSAKNCEIEVKKPGYGTFSDEGCLVEFEDCKIKTATQTIMIDRKGKARFTRIQAESGKYFAYFFSVLGNTSQINEFVVRDCDVVTGEEAFLVSGCNAYIDVRKSRIDSKNGVFMKSEISPDPMNSPIAAGEETYGIKAVLSDMTVNGDILHEDINRQMAITLKRADVNGAIENAFIEFDMVSSWTATKDSHVRIVGSFELDQIDAKEGVTIYAKAEQPKESCVLASGGKIVFE